MTLQVAVKIFCEIIWIWFWISISSTRYHLSFPTIPSPYCLKSWVFVCVWANLDKSKGALFRTSATVLSVKTSFAYIEGVSKTTMPHGEKVVCCLQAWEIQMHWSLPNGKYLLRQMRNHGIVFIFILLFDKNIVH